MERNSNGLQSLCKHHRPMDASGLDRWAGSPASMFSSTCTIHLGHVGGGCSGARREERKKVIAPPSAQKCQPKRIRKTTSPPLRSFTFSPVHPNNFPPNHVKPDNSFPFTSSIFTSITMGFTDFLSDAGLTREFFLSLGRALTAANF